MLILVYNAKEGAILNPIEGQRIKAKLSKRKFTKSEMCEVIGVSRPTYNKLISHPENFTMAQIQKAASYLDLPVNQVIEEITK